jgi:hypothetical protein
VGGSVESSAFDKADVPSECISRSKIQSDGWTVNRRRVTRSSEKDEDGKGARSEPFSVEQLVLMCKKIFLTGAIPKRMREGMLVLLPKNGSTDFCGIRSWIASTSKSRCALTHGPQGASSSMRASMDFARFAAVKRQFMRRQRTCRQDRTVAQLTTKSFSTSLRHSCQTRTNAGFPGPDMQHHNAGRAARQSWHAHHSRRRCIAKIAQTIAE